MPYWALALVETVWGGGGGGVECTVPHIYHIHIFGILYGPKIMQS